MDGETPNETVKDQMVGTTVRDILELFQPMANHLDFLARVDEANGRARASVTLDGATLSGCENLPAITLLAFEKQLKRVRKVLECLPLRAADEMWVASPDLREGVFQSRPSSKHSNKRVPTPIRIFDPSEHCPGGKAEIRDVEVLAGTIERILLTGAPTRQERDGLLRRCDRLIEAVAEARARANEAVVDMDLRPGRGIFNYLLGESAR